MLELADLSGRVIAAAIEVHRELGPGFLETIYERALSVEFRERGIPFVRQMTVPVEYRGVEVGSHRVDILVDGRLLLELKATRKLLDVHFAVVKSYLRALRLRHALLLNFARPRLDVRRAIRGDQEGTAGGQDGGP